jgi:hypothetical protein
LEQKNGTERSGKEIRLEGYTEEGRKEGRKEGRMEGRKERGREMKWKSIYFISRETARNGTEQKGDEVGGKNIK